MRAVILVVALIAAPFAAVPVGAQASFQALGDLPGGSVYSIAFDVSADGAVIVGRGTSAEGPETFRWTQAGGMVGLGDFPGGPPESIAFGASADGGVVVGYGSIEIGYEAFRWTEADGMVGLGDFPGGQFFSHARGVSPDGSVVVGRGGSASGPSEAFRWTQAGGMVGLGDFPGASFNSQANGVSADGSVVVGYGSISSGGIEAFRWTQIGGMVGLGDLPGEPYNSQAQDVSADGTVVVGFGNLGGGTGEAFRWTEAGGMVGLGDFPGGAFRSSASDVSADGAVVVGSGTTASREEAFVWTASDGMRSVQALLGAVVPAGWTLGGATAVAVVGTDAVIGGYATNPDGATEAFRAVLPAVVVAAEPTPMEPALTLAVAPNPTVGLSTIRFDLPASGRARLTIHDALGRQVAVLIDEARAAGAHEALLRVGTLAPGVYLASLEAGGQSVARVLTILR